LPRELENLLERLENARRENARQEDPQLEPESDGASV
jgi:hypothetical protein